MFTGSSGSDYQATEITNDGFWPNINAGDFEKRRGIPAAQDSERIAIALVNAVSEVNQQLEDLKAKYREEGHATAGNVPTFPKMNDKTVLYINTNQQYLREPKLICCRTLQLFIPRTRAITSQTEA